MSEDDDENDEEKRNVGGDYLEHFLTTHLLLKELNLIKGEGCSGL